VNHKSLHCTTTAEDSFLSVCETMMELDLPQTKLKEMITDGVPSTPGKKLGLMGRIMPYMDKQSHEFYIELPCIIDQKPLCGKNVKSEHVLQVVVSVVNFIRQFQPVCRKLILNIVVLKRFSALRL